MVISWTVRTQGRIQVFACLFVCNTATRLLVEAPGLQAVALCTHEHNEASQQEAGEYT